VSLPALQEFLAAHHFYPPVANSVETLGGTPQWTYMSCTSLLWACVESNTSQLTNMDRNERINVSVLTLVSLVVSFHEMMLHGDRLGLDLQLWRNWVFLLRWAPWAKQTWGTCI